VLLQVLLAVFIENDMPQRSSVALIVCKVREREETGETERGGGGRERVKER
jgi:hypothetical protein